MFEPIFDTDNMMKNNTLDALHYLSKALAEDDVKIQEVNVHGPFIEAGTTSLRVTAKNDYELYSNVLAYNTDGLKLNALFNWMVMFNASLHSDQGEIIMVINDIDGPTAISLPDTITSETIEEFLNVQG